MPLLGCNSGSVTPPLSYGINTIEAISLIVCALQKSVENPLFQPKAAVGVFFRILNDEKWGEFSFLAIVLSLSDGEIIASADLR